MGHDVRKQIRKLFLLYMYKKNVNKYMKIILVGVSVPNKQKICGSP